MREVRVHTAGERTRPARSGGGDREEGVVVSSRIGHRPVSARRSDLDPNERVTAQPACQQRRRDVWKKRPSRRGALQEAT